MTRTRQRRQQPEGAIQRAVFQHLRAHGAPGVFAFAVPNGGYRTPVEAAILKATGTIAGVPDIIVVYRGRCLALEIKTKTGRVTNIQHAAHARLREAGAEVAVARGLDEALACLSAWELLRGEVQ